MSKYPVGYAPIADAGPGDAVIGPFFDIRRVVLSQYANSPVILALLDAWGSALDQRENMDRFYRYVWNVETAQGYGLDVLGRIVGVRRVLYIPTVEDYLGFKQDTSAKPFGYGIWYNGSNTTANFALSDAAYRRLILAKAALNLTDASIPAINQILLALFPDYGNCYVRDDGGMHITYVFSEPLTSVDYAIVGQSGVLPKPAGVSVAGEVI